MDCIKTVARLIRLIINHTACGFKTTKSEFEALSCDKIGINTLQSQIKLLSSNKTKYISWIFLFSFFYATLEWHQNVLAIIPFYTYERLNGSSLHFDGRVLPFLTGTPQLLPLNQTQHNETNRIGRSRGTTLTPPDCSNHDDMAHAPFQCQLDDSAFLLKTDKVPLFVAMSTFQWCPLLGPHSWHYDP